MLVIGSDAMGYLCIIHLVALCMLRDTIPSTLCEFSSSTMGKKK